MTEIGAMFEKEKEEAVALAEAKGIVESVDQIAINAHVELEEACRLRGINVAAYDIAKKYIALAEKKELVAV